jgi:glutamyl-tRNA synthetase
LSLTTRRPAPGTTPYVGRLAPSPTGALHQGIARTFLGAWLDARAHGGRLILRVEDVDTVRAVPGRADEIARDLEWLGLDWDVGPGSPDPGGPFVQSQRTSRYLEALAELSALGRTFRCTCSRREIREASAPHGPEDEGPRYPGTCRERFRPRPDREPAVRFRTEPGERVEIRDRLFGELRSELHADVGDFVLRRSDGLWAYQLAVAVDDLDQGVTCVVRGRDLLSSTPRQALLRRLLSPDAAPLESLHLPLLRTPEGHRLSKRDGAVPIARSRAEGRSPREIVGRLAASLGLVPPGSDAAPGELVDAWRTAELPLEDAMELPGSPEAPGPEHG